MNARVPSTIPAPLFQSHTSLVLPWASLDHTGMYSSECGLRQIARHEPYLGPDTLIIDRVTLYLCSKEIHIRPSQIMTASSDRRRDDAVP